MSQKGRSEILPNVLASWLAFSASAVIGFVMPRLILDNVGHELLGVWDLCWSFLAFISFSGIGTGSAIGHYTARTRKDVGLASKVFATGLYLQLVIGVLLATLFGFLISVLPNFLISYEFVQIDEISTIGLLISSTVVVVLLGEIAHGCLLGNHEARTSEYINVAHDITLAISMVIVLIAGLGIVGLAQVTLIIRCLFELARFWVVLTRVDAATVNPMSVRAPVAKRLVLFAAKSSIYGLQELVVFQTVRFLFFIGVGPVVFAAFSRYSTLARQINRLVDRLVIPIPALASDLSARGDLVRIKRMYMYGLKGVLMLSIPALVLFGVLGDTIVTLWMGADFVIPELAWIFCAACMLHTHYSMSAKIIRGINVHGRISAYCLAASIVVLAASYAFFRPADAYQAAWLIALIMVLCVQVPVIFFTWRRLNLSILTQLKNIYLMPVLLNALFFLAVYQSRILLGNGYPTSALLLTAAGGLLLLTAYWFFVCDEQMREKFRETFLQNPPLSVLKG